MTKSSHKKQKIHNTFQRYKRVICGVLEQMPFCDRMVYVNGDLDEIEFAYTRRFYVYIFFRKNGTPLYIGKGCYKRAKVSKRKFKEEVVDYTPIFANLTEKQAFELEEALILKFGTVWEETGSLVNKTRGGPCVYSLSGVPKSPKHRRKISKSLKGRPIGPQSEEHKQHIKEAMNRPEVKEKHRQSHVGYKQTREHIENHANSIRGKKHKRPRSPETCERLSAVNREKWKSPTYRRRMKKALNRPEVKAKKRAAMKKYWAARRKKVA